MALKMTNTEVDGASVVALAGRIVLGEESQALREKFKRLIAEGKKKIVLNMEKIEYIDSAGLGILVAAHVSAKVQGASVKLSNLGRKFQEILQITRLITVFEVCSTEAAAVASFAKIANEAATEKPSVTLAGTVERIIEPPFPGAPEKAEIAIEGADDLHQGIRIDNTLTDKHGDVVRLKEGAEVEVTVEAEPETTASKPANAA